MKTLPEQARELFTEQAFVVLDTETTGKDRTTTEIVEIAIVDHAGRELLTTLVKPTIPISPSACAIHGITDEMVASAPTFPEVWPRIAELLANKTVVVYNASYDIYILEHLSARFELGFWMCSSFCLMQAYADYWQAPGRYGSYKWQSLSAACTQQQVVLTNAHRALGDALATWALLKTLAEKE